MLTPLQPKVTSAEKDFNNWVDRMTHSVNTRVSLFPQSPVSLPNGSINKVAVVAVMEVMNGLNNMDFCLPGWPG